MEGKFQFYKYAPETWEAMLEALRTAHSSIEIEHYIFASDVLGDKFIKILKEKARSGVKVRLLIDAVGSAGFYNSEVPDEMRKAGIEIKFFNPISPWRIHTFTSWFFRDHSKIIIVDKKIAFTGGLGIRENMREWRDTNARIEGPAVEEMSQFFEEMWARGKNLLIRLARLRYFQKTKVHFVTNAPYYKKRFLYHTLIAELRNARRSICLTTPYFIPDRRLARVLRLAAKRGVDVRIIIPEKSDVPTLTTATDSYLDKMLKSKVRVYKYTPTFLHAKTAIVDEDWATFGSLNLDNLSFVYNFEGNIISTKKACIDPLLAHFQEDLNQSREVKREEWAKRPFMDKLREFLIKPVRGFL